MSETDLELYYAGKAVPPSLALCLHLQLAYALNKGLTLVPREYPYQVVQLVHRRMKAALSHDPYASLRAYGFDLPFTETLFEILGLPTPPWAKKSVYPDPIFWICYALPALAKEISRTHQTRIIGTIDL